MRGGKLLILAVGVLLVVGAAGAAVNGGEGVETTPTVQEKSDTDRGGCPGCRARAAGDEEARCRQADAGGCCGAMGRQGRRGMGRQGGRGMGHGGRGMGGGVSRGMGRRGGHGGPPPVMKTARQLVHDYRHEIERQVEMVDNGIVTVTRAPQSSEAAAAIHRHVREMKELFESGGRVRMWDPLFRELFDHADQITMEIEELEDGMKVTETAEDPQVVQLIQAHARKVNEFLERGPAAVHEETPLPAGYGAGE